MDATNICLGPFKIGQRWYSVMRAIIKCLIEAIEYIFEVFVLIELVLNGHRNELIEEEDSICKQRIIVHSKHAPN